MTDERITETQRIRPGCHRQSTCITVSTAIGFLIGNAVDRGFISVGWLIGSIVGALVWEVKTGQLKTWIEAPRDIEVVAFMPDGREVAASSKDGTVGLWDLTTLRQRVKFQCTLAPIISLALTPDGKTLATTHGSKIALWDVPR
jgi:WD40 repeat protein